MENIREKTEELFNSLKRGESFSKEMQEEVRRTLEDLKKQYIEYHQKNKRPTIS